ncbi:MAG: hypothetical protein RBG13Loki_4413 [Promethearchaeota archaeon CR_4]|nr:MAG: hypothetical protein RBG13Loki_4413 [Candidatus Lokiarchaeota archaeon CR_4]
MPKSFVVKTPSSPDTQQGEYVIVTCPKCGKKSYSVIGQKGKNCPVCHRHYTLKGIENLPRYKTPEEVCRVIQVAETKRAGRSDFVPVVSTFHPTTCASRIARTNKVVSVARSIDVQFITWVRNYFQVTGGNRNAGMPITMLVVDAIKAGFVGASQLVEKNIAAGLLVRPKPYSVTLANLND